MKLENFVSLAIRNCQHHIERELIAEEKKRKISSSIDALTLPEQSGSDIPVKLIAPAVRPSSRDFYTRIELRDALEQYLNSLKTDTELWFARMLLEGRSPRSLFSVMYLSPATGYRWYGRIIEDLRSICRG